MKKIFFMLILICIAVFNLNAQDTLDYRLDEITVTSSKVPTSLSNISRSVTTIYANEIQAAPVNSVPELLKYYSSVDVRTRGPVGVQSDISIRGGNFEQTLILINGVKLSDPQTGHHNMNLPVNIDDIERIEILKGPGSKIYGANALAGVVNIITKKNQNTNLSIEISGGENNFYGGEFSLALPGKKYSNRFSFSKKKSDGYAPNTHFDNTTFNYLAHYEFSLADFNINAGYTDKDFGAANFYFLNENQWEHTKTTFINISSKIEGKKYSITPKVFLRNNKDDYSFEFGENIYENSHKTNSYGAEVTNLYESKFGITALSGEFSKDEIKSSNLNDHSRTKGGIALEHALNIGNYLNINFGGFIYKYDKFGWKIWPGVDAGVNLTNNIKAFASIGKSFRLPSFTELYYKSATREGNSELQPEEALTYELGSKFNFNIIKFEASVFRREGKNIIDWARKDDSLPWQTRNIINANTNGAELSLTVSPNFFEVNLPINKINVFYTYLDTEINLNEFKSLYVLDHLKHQLKFNLISKKFNGFENSWSFRFEKRLSADEYFITDTKLSYEIKSFEIFAQAANLFNEEYVEIGGIPMPGRWLIAGIKFNYLP